MQEEDETEEFIMDHRTLRRLMRLNAGVADQLEAWFGEGSPPRGKNGLRKRLSAVASGLETDDGNNVLLPSHGNIVPQK